MTEESVRRGAMVPAWPRRLLAALLLVYAGSMVANRMRSVSSANLEQSGYFRSPAADKGESLIYGIPFASVSYNMPLYSVPDAWLRNYVPRRVSAAAVGWAFCACAVLVFGLGCLLHSSVCGAVSVIILARVVPSDLFGDRWLFALTFLLIAYAAVWRARAPSWRRSSGLVAALGANLLTLSALCLLPFVMAAWEWVERKWDGSGATNRRLEIAALCLLPFLFLSPWVLMNWQLSHRIILFEDGRVDTNLITGALGVVQTINDNEVLARDVAAMSPNQTALSWALQEVLSHPLRYLRSCSRRIGYVLSLYPALFLLSALGAWLWRRRREHRQLALLAGYYVAIHCLMSVEGRYFWPLLPLLSVMSGCVLTGWLRPDDSRWQAPLSSALACAFLAPLMAAVLWISGLVAVYPSRSAQPRSIARELSRHPASAWLWDQNGRELLSQGQVRAAAESFAKALIRDPHPARPVEYVLALGPSAEHLLENRTDPPFMADLARMLLALQRGDPRRARELSGGLIRSIDAAHRDVFHDGTSGMLRPEPELEARIRANAKENTAALREVLRFWPEPAFGDLVPRLKALLVSDPQLASRLDDPGIGDLCVDRAYASFRSGARRTALRELEAARLWRLDPGRMRLVAFIELDWAEDLARQGRRPEALQALARVRRLRLDADPLRQAAEMYRRLGQPGLRLEILRRLAELSPREAAPLLDRADGAARQGRRLEALQALAQARRLSLDAGQSRRAAETYRRLGEPGLALEMLRRMAELAPQDPAPLLEWAEAAARQGRRAEALRALARARGMSLDQRQLRQAALSYRALDDPGRELETLELMARRWPAQAGSLLDWAGVASEKGRRKEALEALDFAQSLALNGRQASFAVDLYNKMQEQQRCRPLFRSLLGRPLRELKLEEVEGPGFLLGLAEEAARAGRQDLAKECLRLARRSQLDAGDLGRIALIYQRMSQYEAALEVLDQLVRDNPGQPRWLSDRGVLKILTGRRGEAVADLQAAIAREPGSLPAYLSLGSLYVSMGRRAEAAKLYQEALRASKDGRDRDIRRLIQEAERRCRP